MHKRIFLLGFTGLFSLMTFLSYGQNTPAKTATITIEAGAVPLPNNNIPRKSDNLSAGDLSEKQAKKLIALDQTAPVIPNQTVTAGQATQAINFPANGCLYSWTNNTPGIGLAASGIGNIPAFTTINSGSSNVTATITATPISTSYAYITNVLSNNVSVIATATNSIIATIPVGSGPIGVAITPDGSRAYVVNISESTISVISTATNSVLATIPVDGNIAALTINPDGTRLYTANLEGSVSVFNTADNTLITTIPLTFPYITKPVYVSVSPDGQLLYVICNASKDVVVINASTGAFVADIPAGNSPYMSVTTPDGKFLYVSDELGAVSVINTADNTVLKNIRIGTSPATMAMSPDGKKVYVTDPTTADIYIIDTSTNTVVNTINAPYSVQGISITPDGASIYATNRGNSVYVYNTATLAKTADITVGNYPLPVGNFITPAVVCNSSPLTFNIAVTPSTPAIAVSGSPSAVSTSYGTASPATSFMVSGALLSSGILVTPPAGFEVSADDINFGNTVTLPNAGGTVYIRLAGTTNAGNYQGNIKLTSTGVGEVDVSMPNSTVTPAIINITGTSGKIYGEQLTDVTYYYNTPGFTYNGFALYNGNTFKSIHFSFGQGAAATDPVGTYYDQVTLSDFEGDNGYLPSNYTINYNPFNLIVQPAPITITANNVTKPYGTTLTDVPASTSFTVSGMQNGETIGDVMIHYGAGASATSSAGTYAGSVVPSAASGGSFSPGNFTITYQAGDLLVAAPPAPMISTVGAASNLQTVYGTPSPSTNVQVSGSNMTAPLLVSAPSGFEISTDNSNFSATVSLTPDASGTIASTPVYIRLAATTPVGNYTGNMQLTSPGAADGSLALNGIVTPAPLVISASPATKIYGDVLNSTAGVTTFAISGLQNGETAGSITLNYGGGGAATDPVGVYKGTIIPSAASGGNFNPGNYNITYNPADLTVVQTALTITADNLNRAFATPNPTLTVTYTGFVNGDGQAQLISMPVISTTAILTSPAGEYPITVSGALAANYNITYVAGTLTVYSAPQNIKIPNTFTPNGDGVNDQWNIKDLQYYTSCTVQIFNRYGQNLYYSKGYGEAWDGTYNRQPLPVGTYYYIISLNDGTQTRLSGYVAILK